MWVGTGHGLQSDKKKKEEEEEEEEQRRGQRRKQKGQREEMCIEMFENSFLGEGIDSSGGADLLGSGISGKCQKRQVRCQDP